MTAQTAVIVPNPQPDLAQAERFLTLLDEEAESFTFQTFDDLGSRKDHSLARILHGNLEQHAIDLQRLQWRRAGAYVTFNATDGKGRRLANMVRPRGIFCEWDHVGQALPDWPIDPHVIVESSAGKFHVYWFSLDMEWADFDALMQVMVAWGSDPNAKDRSRVLRLPGFWHQKHDTPFQVRIIHESGALPYCRDELLAAFPVTAEPPHPMESFTVDPQSDTHWMAIVIRVVGEQAANTWAKPTHSRNAQVISLGFELAERGVPESFDETALRKFAEAMRPTNASGQVTGMNWDNEWAALKHGRNKALTGGKPTILHGAAVAESLIKAENARQRSKAKSTTPAMELPKAPASLLNPPGLLGEFVAWAVRTARFPQPILAAVNGLALLGTIIGQTARTETDLRTNIYVLGIAPSASGKDHSRKCAKKLMAAAGLQIRLGGENLASDSGLLEAVYRSPACLFQIDEFGRVLKTLVKPDKTHLFAIPTTLMQLYSASNDLFLGKEYAGGDRRDIDQPCACLYGTTVPQHFFAALTHDEAEDGFLARFFVATGTDDPTEQNPAMEAPPESLIRDILAIAGRSRNADPRGNLDAVLCARPPIYAMDAAAKAQFAELAAWVNKTKPAHRQQGSAAIWGRCWEQAAKAALIVAASRNQSSEWTITADDAAFGIDLARWSCASMAAHITTYVAENETENTAKRVERMIRESGSDGMTMGMLHTKTRFLKRKDRADVVDELVDGGFVFRQTEKSVNGSDRPVFRLIHAQFAD